VSRSGDWLVDRQGLPTLDCDINDTHYNWSTSSGGSYAILSRAVDDSLNLEVPGPGITLTVTGTTAATGVSLFTGSDTLGAAPVNDPHPVELGVKFQSSQAGTVSAIRFYKGSQNIGTHTANLWSATGTLLSTATFTGETTSLATSRSA
jgi:hypothetical protein